MAVAFRDALSMLSVAVAGVGTAILYYVFVYPAGSYALAGLGAVWLVVWFATPSTDQS